MQFGAAENGSLKLMFAETITLMTLNTANILIDDKAYVAVSLSDADRSIIVEAPSNITGTVVVKGVKYPRLFPSYSFTFTALKQI